MSYYTINEPPTNPLYWDEDRQQMYWVEWFETGNSDIPTRHYIDLSPQKMRL